MKKILVTGASGFVGSRFVARWRSEYNILTPTHAELDITDYASVSSYFVQNSPDVVVHLAALSNTGYCEQNEAESYRVNVDGAANIARAAAMCGAKMIFFSSDQVYNGNLESGLLSEDVVVAPENVYGRHKLEAEERVLYFSMQNNTFDMELPNDPFMLMSAVNMYLRDQYSSLDELCDSLDVDRKELEEKLRAAGFEYSAENNKFW